MGNAFVLKCQVGSPEVAAEAAVDEEIEDLASEGVAVVVVDEVNAEADLAAEAESVAEPDVPPRTAPCPGAEADPELLHAGGDQDLVLAQTKCFCATSLLLLLLENGKVGSHSKLFLCFATTLLHF